MHQKHPPANVATSVLAAAASAVACRVLARLSRLALSTGHSLRPAHVAVAHAWVAGETSVV